MITSQLQHLVRNIEISRVTVLPPDLRLMCDANTPAQQHHWLYSKYSTTQYSTTDKYGAATSYSSLAFCPCVFSLWW